ncbi:MAG: hypothetical protein JWM14_1469 [Chitinophagaceae bacterium]|nr:hypothetical protein [Chitinophagaceae bacterium]
MLRSNKFKKMQYPKLKQILGLFMILLCIEVHAQSQNENLRLIIFAKKYEKGFYRTFEEFRKNAPSIPFNGEVDNHLTVRLTFNGNLPCPDQTAIWGFCDGTGIYISRSFSFSEKEIYYRIQHIGRFCDYETLRNPYYADMPHNRTLQVGIDFNTGQSFTINKVTIESILFRDEELYNNFSSNSKKNMVAREYLRYYSKKHPEEIELVIVPQ